jgi:hypothetical protein
MASQGKVVTAKEVAALALAQGEGEHARARSLILIGLYHTKRLLAEQDRRSATKHLGAAGSDAEVSKALDAFDESFTTRALKDLTDKEAEQVLANAYAAVGSEYEHPPVGSTNWWRMLRDGAFSGMLGNIFFLVFLVALFGLLSLSPVTNPSSLLRGLADITDGTQTQPKD